jgi:tripartite-type tricarboxylate transporter receptor subunit TctC
MYRVGATVCVALSLLLALSGMASAQDYPARPIRLVLPQPPGGAVDFISRTLGAALQKSIGQAVVVDNRPGANGIVAAELVAKAPADGYTLFMAVDTNLVVNPQFYAKVPYDPFRDFAPISVIARNALTLVANPSLPANSVAEVIALARAQPGKINYGSVGHGTQHHLGMELFKTMAKINLVHVPYKGQAAALADLAAGVLGVMLSGTPAALALSKGGQIKILAVTSLERSRFLPDVPTMAESGLPGYDVGGWFGLLAPANTPPNVLARLSEEVAKVMGDSEFRAALLKQGLEPVGNTPSQMTALMRSDTEKWGRVIRESGAKIE